MKCRNCVHLYRDWCPHKLDSPDPDLDRECKDYKQATNADRIRAMSDEELAAVLCTADFCNYCDYEREDGTCFYIETSPDGRLFDGCVSAALKYLKQPAEEDT